tara:strand:- start:661 stop:891 length:231 start_codon:yes stop_codon:yes gene_type:complete
MTERLNINNIKDWIVFSMSIIATVAGVIFWVSTIHDPKFEEVEKEFQLLRSEITQIRLNNNEILRIVGRLEGKLEN